MAKVLRCRDAGVACDWQACGETDEELLAKAAEHGRKVHGITEITPELAAKVKAAIKEEPCR